jgi:NDP-sugar pyrophosphorylase family protein
MKKIKAMILAAGVGSRLDPLTKAIPKPLVPIVNIPVMEHHLNWLTKFGIKDIAVNLWHLPQKIKKYFGSGFNRGIKLVYSFEKNLLGTAGGVMKMKDFLKGGTFVISSADVLTDIDLKRLIFFHKKSNSLATIALKEVENTEHFGIVIIKNNGQIVSFQEKPKANEAQSNLANAGIYIFEPGIFSYIPENKFCDFGRNVFPVLVKEKVPFFGLKTDGYWRDVGIFTDYQRSNFDALEGIIKIRISGKKIRKGLKQGKKFTAFIGANCALGHNVELIGKVIIGDNCKIGNNVYLEDVIIWSNSIVGKSSKLQNVIIGSKSKINSETFLSDKVIAGKSIVSAGFNA